MHRQGTRGKADGMRRQIAEVGPESPTVPRRIPTAVSGVKSGETGKIPVMGGGISEGLEK